MSKFYFPFDEPVKIETIIAVLFLIERGDIDVEDGFDLSDVTIDEDHNGITSVEFDQRMRSWGDNKSKLIADTIEGLNELRSTGMLEFLFRCYVVHRWTLQANNSFKKKARTISVLPADEEFVKYIGWVVGTFPNGYDFTMQLNHDLSEGIEVSTFTAKIMVEIVRSGVKYTDAPDKVREAFWHWVANNSSLVPYERHSSYGATLNDAITRLLNVRIVYDYDKRFTIDRDTNTVVNSTNFVNMAIDYYSLIPVEWLDRFEFAENSYRLKAVADKSKVIEGKQAYTLLHNINTTHKTSSVYGQKPENNRLLVLLAVELAGYRTDNAEMYSMEYPFKSEQHTYMTADYVVKMVKDTEVGRIVENYLREQAEDELNDGTLGIPEHLRNYFNVNDYAENLYDYCNNSEEMARVMGSGEDTTTEEKYTELQLFEGFITYLKLHKKANEYEDETMPDTVFYADIPTLEDLERIVANESEEPRREDEAGLGEKWLDWGSGLIDTWLHIAKTN